MRIWIPAEVKAQEARVALTPCHVAQLAAAGHSIRVQAGAGVGAGFSDEEYSAACGSSPEAGVVPGTSAAMAWADLVLKVKEPQPQELAEFRPGQMLFSYLHLAADQGLTEELLRRGVTALGFETLEGEGGGYPLLAPMSQIAGRLSVQYGAKLLEKQSGGLGILLGGVSAAPAAQVTVVGGGMVGREAAELAAAMGAEVTLLEKDAERLAELERDYASCAKIQPILSEPGVLQSLLPKTALLIFAVLVPGRRPPLLLHRADLALMQRGSVVVDVAIDQGGCTECGRPTTHAQPAIEVDGVLHCSVANLPGAVPRTSTAALSAAIIESVLLLASLAEAAFDAPEAPLYSALNLRSGKLIHPALRATFPSLGRGDS